MLAMLLRNVLEERERGGLVFGEYMVSDCVGCKISHFGVPYNCFLKMVQRTGLLYACE